MPSAMGNGGCIFAWEGLLRVYLTEEMGKFVLLEQMRMRREGQETTGRREQAGRQAGRHPLVRGRQSAKNREYHSTWAWKTGTCGGPKDTMTHNGTVCSTSPGRAFDVIFACCGCFVPAEPPMARNPAAIHTAVRFSLFFISPSIPILSQLFFATLINLSFFFSPAHTRPPFAVSPCLSTLLHPRLFHIYSPERPTVCVSACEYACSNDP
jgi:hypothetical protein